MVRFITAIIAVFILYGPLPTLTARLFKWRAIRTVNQDDSVFLTFDDGPDPQYTPQILDILREHDVKASFFLVADRAAEFPDLVKRIAEEGHEIGTHGQKHHSLWLKGWRSTIRELLRSKQVLQGLTGSEPVWFRPPWGLVNLAVLFSAVFRRQKVFLWSVMPVDWTRRASAASIAGYVRRKARSGSIIVLHDSDKSVGAAAGSPLATIQALPLLLGDLKSKGYQFKTINQVMVKKNNLSAPKMLLQSVWMIWEHLFEWFTRMRSVYAYEWGIFKVFVTKHTGSSIQCENGVWIHSGDWVGELHLDNKQILEMVRYNGVDRVALITARMVRDSLEQVCAAVESTPELGRVKALTGITLLHRGITGLGFELHQLKSSWFQRLTMFYLRILLQVFHPSGKKRIAVRTQKLVPMMLVMTKESLMQRYATRKDALPNQKGGVM